MKIDGEVQELLYTYNGLELLTRIQTSACTEGDIIYEKCATALIADCILEVVSAVLVVNKFLSLFPKASLQQK